MKYIAIVLAFFLIGCSQKQKKEIFIESREQNISIPKQFLQYYTVEPFILEKNTTKIQWRNHIKNLKIGHESCEKQMNRLQKRYGK